MEFETINALVYAALSELECPVRDGWYDENINHLHVTFLVAHESPEDYDDDEITTINYVVQVDIWSREDDTEIYNQIRKLMKKNNFDYFDGANLFETDTKIYHRAMRFNYYKEENYG